MQSLMEDENVSLESIVAYKKDIFSASDAEGRIKDIENEITSLKSQLVANENSSQETQARRVSLLTAILGKMNELYHQIDRMEILRTQAFLLSEMRSIPEARQPCFI